MSFSTVDTSRPLGSEKGNVLDDAIRQTRQWATAVFQEISGYPDQVALIMPTWTTANRPTGVLRDNLMGYNTDLDQIEIVQSGSWTPLPLVSTDSARVNGIRFTISDTAPSDPQNGKEYWVDTSTNLSKVYKSGGWVILGAAYQ